MNDFVFLLVLSAAALHAGWNAAVKGARDTFLTTVLVSGMAGALSAAAFALSRCARHRQSAVHRRFGAVPDRLFRRARPRLSLRGHEPQLSAHEGTAPALVAFAGLGLTGEVLSAATWGGLGLVCLGIVGLAWPPGKDAKGMRFAMGNAVVIAAYTLIDGVGVRMSGAPAAYTMWIFVLTAIPLAGWAIAVRKADFVAYAAKNLLRGTIGGFGVVGSYGIALWAMTKAPIAVVAALRETSILFAMAISALVLKERVTPRRIVLATAGVATLRLA